MHDKGDHVINSRCEDFPAYRYNTGLIYGLGIAEDLLLELDQELLQNESP